MLRVFGLQFFVYLFAFLFLAPNPSLAFKKETRCQLLRDAVYFSPEPLKSYLTKNFAAVHSGAHFADRNRRARKSVKPRDAKTVYLNLVKALRAKKINSYNTAHSFGVLACFIAETISPDNHRLAGDLIPQYARYDGHQDVDDIDVSVKRLVRDYRKPYRGNSHPRVTDYLYNTAVNEIVDHWVSAWQRSGRDPRPLNAPGILIARDKTVIKFSHLPA